MLTFSLSPLTQVEFIDEEGTGLGPSLEFYALVAAELQCRSLGLWLCDDDFPDDSAREVRGVGRGPGLGGGGESRWVGVGGSGVGGHIMRSCLVM